MVKTLETTYPNKDILLTGRLLVVVVQVIAPIVVLLGLLFGRCVTMWTMAADLFCIDFHLFVIHGRIGCVTRQTAMDMLVELHQVGLFHHDCAGVLRRMSTVKPVLVVYPCVFMLVSVSFPSGQQLTTGNRLDCLPLPRSLRTRIFLPASPIPSLPLSWCWHHQLHTTS